MFRSMRIRLTSSADRFSSSRPQTKCHDRICKNCLYLRGISEMSFVLGQFHKLSQVHILKRRPFSAIPVHPNSPFSDVVRREFCLKVVQYCAHRPWYASEMGWNGSAQVRFVLFPQELRDDYCACVYSKGQGLRLGFVKGWPPVIQRVGPLTAVICASLYHISAFRVVFQLWRSAFCLFRLDSRMVCGHVPQMHIHSARCQFQSPEETHVFDSLRNSCE
jgi:hypothetical protein